MYTDRNFKTKKALKDAVKNGEDVTCFNPGPFGDSPRDGTITLEGPHYPKPHRWYASGTMKDGVLVKVS